MANGWRRRRRRTIVPMGTATIGTTMARMIVPLLVISAVTEAASEQTARALRRADPGGFRAQRICYQCQMPMQCQSGFCYGDFCVKSMVADKYVSKGCENRTISASNAAFYTSANPSKASQSHGPLYARSAAVAMGEGGGGRGAAQMPSHAIGIAPGCVQMRVFGVQNTVCYCDDTDYCNGSVGMSLPVTLIMTTIIIVLLSIVTPLAF
ncbi:hypothetical protein niasHT_004270 [Heterodera trifolii]|uniref:Protein sleepless n=1 Tax=Heterodera trifolii TaxID=157864 RepID=A0ABD2LR48_9BILA